MRCKHLEKFSKMKEMQKKIPIVFKILKIRLQRYFQFFAAAISNYQLRPYYLHIHKQCFIRIQLFVLPVMRRDSQVVFSAWARGVRKREPFRSRFWCLACPWLICWSLWAVGRPAPSPYCQTPPKKTCFDWTSTLFASTRAVKRILARTKTAREGDTAPRSKLTSPNKGQWEHESRSTQRSQHKRIIKIILK